MVCNLRLYPVLLEMVVIVSLLFLTEPGGKVKKAKDPGRSERKEAPVLLKDFERQQLLDKRLVLPT